MHGMINKSIIIVITTSFSIRLVNILEMYHVVCNVQGSIYNLCVSSSHSIQSSSPEASTSSCCCCSIFHGSFECSACCMHFFAKTQIKTIVFFVLKVSSCLSRPLNVASGRPQIKSAHTHKLLETHLLISSIFHKNCFYYCAIPEDVFVLQKKTEQAGFANKTKK